MEKGIVLLSGGIDSPVAAYCALQNNSSLFAIHFSTIKITGKESVEKSKKLSKLLGIKKLFLADVSNQFAEISKKCEHKQYFVLTKRFMLKTAEKIAEKHGLDFLVTGENIGQVSSQTLSNLSAIDSAVKIPVIRPLLCLDKMEVVALAREIKTLEISEGKEMCDALGPPHPATKTDLKTVKDEEKKIDSKKLIETALKEIEIF